MSSRSMASSSCAMASAARAGVSWDGRLCLFFFFLPERGFRGHVSMFLKASKSTIFRALLSASKVTNTCFRW